MGDNMFGLIGFNEEKARKEERDRINEMRLRRLELINDGKTQYLPNPKGISWKYHKVTSDGDIIETK